MRGILAVLVSVLLVGIPTGIIFYLFSYSIVELLGKEIYAIAIFVLAFLILVWDVYKKVLKFFKRS
ncbi:hypothetical protein DMZ48_14140 [Robertkochia solimangrovi]|nr:hypothetical protein DMZ48_14140 [Robertkochia solimangrovi]